MKQKMNFFQVVTLIFVFSLLARLKEGTDVVCRHILKLLENKLKLETY